jgi:RIO kinase 2
LITNEEGTKLTVIDFPQCISVNHPNAEMYFNRDVECIYTFFDKMVQREISDYDPEQDPEHEEGNLNKKRFILNVADYPMPVLREIEVVKRLDRELKTKGHITLTEEKELEKVFEEAQENQD